jgi:hypothetical protein
LKRRRFYEKYFVEKVYRNGSRPYKKRWRRKRANEKKGFMRYSTGLKWRGKYDPYKPAFWRTYQTEYWKKVNPDEILPSGYTRNQTWIALCKSWNGFLMAKRDCDPSDMKQYIGQIRKLQKELGLRQTEFEGYSPAELASIDLENDEDFWMEKYGATV